MALNKPILIKVFLKFLKINFINAIKRWLSVSLITLVALISFFILPQTIHAANGGRIGGGSFRAPAIPQTRSYEGNYRFNAGSYRGGIGFPFILPFFGFGGGFLGLLLLLTITGAIGNLIRKGITNSSQSPSLSIQKNSQTATLSQMQLGLLASGKDVQESIKKLAETADTTSKEGLQKVLQESTIVLLRNQDLWVYANTESGSVPLNILENTFNRISISERSKLKQELISNFSGNLEQFQSSPKSELSLNPINEFIVVSILIASQNNLNLKELISIKELEENVKILGSTTASELIALEIIWQPEGNKEILSQEELLISYPNMKRL